MGSDIKQLTIEVRRTFQLLRAAGDRLHEDLGVTTSMRAILEYLGGCAPCTVPDLARRKAVSRQSVQQIVDLLSRRGLVEARPNARHGRSPLFVLTEKCASTFAEMQRREALVIAALKPDLKDVDVRAATAALRTLADAVERRVLDGERTNGAGGGDG